MVSNFSIKVTSADIEEYEKERLARLEHLAKIAPKGVPFEWNPPALNDDGSLASAQWGDPKWREERRKWDA